MYRLLRPLLFRLEPERAHGLTLRLLELAGRMPPALAALRAGYAVVDSRLETQALGLRFANPVGLAAGYDKDGLAVPGLAALGFGHIEVGTVTPRPQPGNPPPRVFRVPEARAVINRMGFPSRGAMALRLPARGPHRPVVGVNLGKNKDTPLESAAEDYCALLRQLGAQADYAVVNISSPNTPGLRALQTRQALEPLLRAVSREREQLPQRVPLLVKIAPDLAEAEIDGVLEAVRACGVDGLIATNTTLARPGLPETVREAGGLSGAPLRARSLEVVRHLARRTRGSLPIIGVGGILGPDDALQMIRAGAWLVQVYTGLVYAGPGLVHGILQELCAACEREGVRRVEQMRGEK